MDLFSTSLSGLTAAQTRLQASATNIANQSSTSRIENGITINEPFQPVEATSTSIEPSGAQSQIQPNDSKPLLVYAPNHSQSDDQGLLALPDVDLGHEVVEQILARQQFAANLNVLERANEALGQLLDQDS